MLMEKYGVQNIEEQQRAELESVKKQLGETIKSASKMSSAELVKQAEEMARLAQRQRDLEEALKNGQ